MAFSLAQRAPAPMKLLGALFLAALALRLLVFAAVAHEPRKFYTYDSDGYDRRAMNLLRYGQFASEAAPPLTPDLDRTPLYPLYLAAVWGTAGHHPWVAALLQVLLGSLTAVAAALLARELRLPPAAWLVSGLVVALDPVSAMNANRLLTETIFTLLITIGILLVVQSWNGAMASSRVRNAETAEGRDGAEGRTTPVGGARAAPTSASAPSARSGHSAILLLAAFILSLATLTRPISQALPLALLPLLLAAFWPAGRARAMLLTALFVAVSSALPLAWAARNYQATGVFTLSTISDTNLIYYRARAVLADVENISQDAAWARLQTEVDTTVAAENLTPAESVALQRRIALAYFRDHPTATMLMLVKGVGRILADPGYTIACTMLDRSSTAFDCFPGKSSMNEPGLLGKAAGRVGQMSVGQVLALAWSATLLAATYAAAALGTIAMLRERRWLAVTLIVLLASYFVGLAAGAEANSRFRVPALPFVAVLAGHGVAVLLAWRGARAARRAARSRAAIGQV